MNMESFLQNYINGRNVCPKAINMGPVRGRATYGGQDRARTALLPNRSRLRGIYKPNVTVNPTYISEFTQFYIVDSKPGCFLTKNGRNFTCLEALISCILIKTDIQE